MSRPNTPEMAADHAAPTEVGPHLESLEPRLLMAANGVTKFRILDAAAAEGGAGDPGRVVFVVKRLGSKVGRAVVKYRTVALAHPDAAVYGTDFNFGNGRLVFRNRQKTKFIVINLIGNAVAENNKLFAVQLRKPKNAKINKAFALGTIADDDGANPTVSINDLAVVEGNNGTKTVFFTVTLSKASGGTVTVDYKSSAGSAHAPEDYLAVPLQTLTFTAGQTVKSIAVQIVNDRNPAQKLFETFFITLSNPSNVSLAKAVGTGTIEDNDQ